MTHTLEFNRIRHLYEPSALEAKVVTIVGLGSGGAPVCDHLTMNGVRRWRLFDADELAEVNLVKHPRMRRDLHRPKVIVQSEWVLDRNPNAEVEAYHTDVLRSDSFAKAVSESDLVLSCTDTKTAREYINDVCVGSRTACVTASVFRTGIGGEIFGYFPPVTGCYRCLQLYATANNLDLPDDLLGLTDEESERIYGLGEQEYRASGLSMDIQMIAAIQARMGLSFLLQNISNRIRPLRANWIIFANRRAKGIFPRHFDSTQYLLKPQALCSCNEEPEHVPMVKT